MKRCKLIGWTYGDLMGTLDGCRVVSDCGRVRITVAPYALARERDRALPEFHYD